MNSKNLPTRIGLPSEWTKFGPAEGKTVSDDEIKRLKDEAEANRAPGRLVVNRDGTETAIDEKEHSLALITDKFGVRNPKTMRKELVPGTEITWDACRLLGVRRPVFDNIMQDFEDAYINSSIEAYRQLTAKMSPEQRGEQWQGVAVEMMKEGQYAADFQGGRNDFFAWPVDATNGNGSNENWHTLIKICHAFGVPNDGVPSLGEIEQAYQYGVAHSHFHQVRSYKRADYRRRDSVVPFTGVQTKVETRGKARDRAFEKIHALHLPVGFNLTQDKALAFGLTQEEFNALVEPMAEERGRDFTELQTDVRSAFNKTRLQ